MKSYCENDMIWVSVSELAEEYHKSRKTILNWIYDGFLIQMGYSLRKDPSGYWYIGKPSKPETLH